MKLITDKRGLEFKKAFFAIIVVGMAIYGIGVWIGDWNSTYDSGLTYDLGDYNKLDEMSSYATSTKENISVKSSFELSNFGDFEGTSIRGSFGILNTIFTPFSVVFGDGGLIDSIANRWNIPNYIIIGLVSMMVLAIIFSIIALFFRRESSSA